VRRWTGLALVLLEASASAQAVPPADQGPAFDGELTLGLRLLDVNGSRAQYDEDVNLEEGLFLRALEFRARRLEGLPIESLTLSAHGVGEPFAAYRLETQGGPWRTNARFDRSRYVGNAQADQHPFDLERSSGTLDFDYQPRGSSTRSSFGLETLSRDGLGLGSRSVGVESVSGFPVREQQRDTGVRGAFATEVDGWQLDLDAGLRTLDSRDRRSFALPSPHFPGTIVSEDFRADQDGTGEHGHLGLSHALGEDGAHLALGLGWESVDVTGDAHWQEAAFFIDPSTPFERDTQGELTQSRDEFAGDVHYVQPLTAELDLDLGYRREHERGDGRLTRTVATDELTGDPPSLSVLQDTNEHESTLDLFTLGTNAELGAGCQLDAELEWGGENLQVEDVSDGVVVRSFDGREREFGGQGTLRCPLGAGWNLDLGAGHARRPTESSQVGVAFDFADDRATFGRLDCRWRGHACSAGADARFEHRESDALNSRGDLGTYGLSFAGQPGADVRLDARASWRTFALESDTTFLFFDPGVGVSEVPGVVTFDGHELGLQAGLELDLAPLRPRLAWNGAHSNGDSAYSYQRASLTLPWDAGDGFELGLELQYLEFAGDGALDASDYDARLVELYVRHAWGR